MLDPTAEPVQWRSQTFSMVGLESRHRRRRGFDAEGVEGVGNGEGISPSPLPSRLGSLGERRKLSQRGPGRSPGRN